MVADGNGNLFHLRPSATSADNSLPVSPRVLCGSVVACTRSRRAPTGAGAEAGGVPGDRPVPAGLPRAVLAVLRRGRLPAADGAEPQLHERALRARGDLHGPRP